jgi:PHD/YefM family antitoxin component YafN of YafNO toxin-antitoxin module
MAQATHAYIIIEDQTVSGVLENPDELDNVERSCNLSVFRIQELVKWSKALSRNVIIPMTFFAKWRRKMTFADQHRFIAAQKAKIHTQREFIRLLERHREDAEIVQMEKEILDSMMRTLNSASSHLRSVMERASRAQKRRFFSRDNSIMHFA